MPYDREFATVDLLLNCNTAETRGVDAFALCIIKMERQLRRLFTFSVFQSPCFTHRSIPKLKDALAGEGKIYFEGFIRGFEALHPKTIGDLIGPDYARLQSLPDVVTKFRNKIFHGQLTGQELSRAKLIGYASGMREWCRLLGDGGRSYMGYDGFSDSFHKAMDARFVAFYKRSVTSVDDYKDFLKTLSR
jgi:hypothetical protein